MAGLFHALVRFRLDRPIQPELLRKLNKRFGISRSDRQPIASSQEMNILEQQEMSRSRPEVKEKLEGWYD